MIGVSEWNRFKKRFPELAAEYRTFTLDSHHPHALKLEMRNGEKLYFACGKTENDFTLTTNEGVINYIRFGRKWKT